MVQNDIRKLQIFDRNLTFQAEGEEDPLNKARSNHAQRKIEARKTSGKVEQHLEEQFTSGRVMGMFLVDILTNKINT